MTPHTGTTLLSRAALLAALLLVNGCGGPASDSPTPPSSLVPTVGQAPTPTETPTRRIDIRFSDGVVDGGVQRIRLPLGAAVDLGVDSDVPDELHLHGYDRSAGVGPGVPTGRVSFVADLPGVFELELEELGEPLAQLEVG